MPNRIEHIDAIARQEQRDVLYVAFHPAEARNSGATNGECVTTESFDWQQCAARKDLITWLDAKGIAWRSCGHFASTDSMLSYQGQIYIDLRYEPQSLVYRALAQYLEFPDGRMRYPEATFYVVELSAAMKNAEHDAPGFWERWAENF